MNSRKPEWTPPGAGKEFASSVVSGGTASKNSVSHAAKAQQGRRDDLSSLFRGVREANRTLLSKAITLIESNAPQHFEQGQELLRQLLPYSGDSIRIGITGVPGAGKSTFIEVFGLWLTEHGHKVAVLAVDPSSSISKGSILGDKTRMEQLSRHPNSFIRPSPSAGILGGVARKTRETIILCEAAGYDVILIETVGVGQSETAVRNMVDFFLVMQIAGAGDELQSIKKGIIELADLIVVNKADGDNILHAEAARNEYNHALHYLRPANDEWHPKALTCSALNRVGIEEIWNSISEYSQKTKSSGYFQKVRIQQNLHWFQTLVEESVLHLFFARPEVAALYTELGKEIESGKLPVASAVQQIIKLLQ